MSTEIVPDAALPPLQPAMLHQPAARAQHRPAARAPTRPAELTVSPFRRRTVAEVYAQTRAAWEVRHESAEKDSSAATAARASAALATGGDDAALSSPPVASQELTANTERADAGADGSETVPEAVAAGSPKAGTDEKAEVPRQQTGAAAAEARDAKRESTASQQHKAPPLVSAAAAPRLNPQSAAGPPPSAASPQPPGPTSGRPPRPAGAAGNPGATVATSFRRPRSAVAAHQAGRGAPAPVPRKSEEGLGSPVEATASQAPAAQRGARESAVASLKRVPASGLSQLDLPTKPPPGLAVGPIASLGAAPGSRASRPAVPAAVPLQRSRHPGAPATADAVEAEQAPGTRVDELPAAVGQAGSLHENPLAYAAAQAPASPGPQGPAAAAETGAAVASQGVTAQDNPLFLAPSGSLMDLDMSHIISAAAIPAPPGKH